MILIFSSIDFCLVGGVELSMYDNTIGACYYSVCNQLTNGPLLRIPHAHEYTSFRAMNLFCSPFPDASMHSIGHNEKRLLNKYLLTNS
jgi:hypothetical protein